MAEYSAICETSRAVLYARFSIENSKDSDQSRPVGEASRTRANKKRATRQAPQAKDGFCPGHRPHVRSLDLSARNHRKPVHLHLRMNVKSSSLAGNGLVRF